MTSHYALRVLLAIILILVAVNVYAVPTNLLFNPGFETPAVGVPPGMPVIYDSLCLGGGSAADSWGVWMNECNGYMETALVPSTLPGGGDYMLEVTFDGLYSGIYQEFLPFNTGPAHAFGSAWIYLKSGSCVGIGMGNDGSFSVTSSTCVARQWIHLTTLNGVSPANEFVVYSIIPSGFVLTDFYVDNVSVTSIPEPASMTLLLVGTAEVLRRRLGKAK